MNPSQQERLENLKTECSGKGTCWSHELCDACADKYFAVPFLLDLIDSQSSALQEAKEALENIAAIISERDGIEDNDAAWNRMAKEAIAQLSLPL